MWCQKLCQDTLAEWQLRSLQKSKATEPQNPPDKNPAVQAEVCQDAVCLLCFTLLHHSPRRSLPEILPWRGDTRHPVTLASYPSGNTYPLKHLCISESVWKASWYWALTLLIAYTILKISNPVTPSHVWYIAVWSISLIILKFFFPVDLQN